MTRIFLFLATNADDRGLDPPKIAVEFDTRTNNDTLANCASASTADTDTRNDPFANDRDAVQFVYWGGKKLDIPSLVEIWRTAPYLHDGRAATLEEQALLPVENPNELGHDWGAVEQGLRRHPLLPRVALHRQQGQFHAFEDLGL